MRTKRPLLASSRERLSFGVTPPTGMVRLADLLGETAMQFCRDDDEAVAGRYVVELRRDGSLMSVRSIAEHWLEFGDELPAEPTLAALTEMYEQIAPSAEAFFAECGVKPALMADMYDRFLAAGFDMSMVERLEKSRVLQ